MRRYLPVRVAQGGQASRRDNDWWLNATEVGRSSETLGALGQREPRLGS